MGWLLLFLLLVVGIPVFMWAYGRHLNILTGPWIATEMSQDD